MTRFKWAALLSAIAAAAFFTFVYATTPAWAACDPDDEAAWTESVVLEVVEGENLTTEAESLMLAAGIPPDEWGPAADCGRVLAELPFVFSVGLRMTPAEAAAAGRAQHGKGVQAVTTAFTIELSPEGVMGAAYFGPQITPSGYTRIGAEPLSDDAVDGEGFADVDIATVDTGIDAGHRDLNVVGGHDCTHEAMLGLREPDAWRRDNFGHGTHTAGTDSAIDNDVDTLGVAAGARQWSLPVLGDTGSGTMFTLLCGANWLLEHASTIEAANWSLGGFNAWSECWSWDTLHNAFCRMDQAGIVNVVSAGNGGTDSTSYSPANYGELDTVVVVEALTDYDGQPGGLAAPPEGIPTVYRDDWRALFSNYGPMDDAIAPGVYIPSTTPANTIAYAHGTSMAAPHVTGTIAAHLAEHPTETGAEAVAAVLAWSAQPGWTVRSGWDAYVGPTDVPLIRFGAPSYDELVANGTITEEP